MKPNTEARISTDAELDAYDGPYLSAAECLECGNAKAKYIRYIPDKGTWYCEHCDSLVEVKASIDEEPTKVASIIIPGRPWTINDAIRDHWTKNASKTKALRQQSFVLWKQTIKDRLPYPLRVVIQPGYKSRVIPDVASTVPSVKAIIDGLVDTGYIPDDTQAYIAEHLYKSALVGQTRDTLLIELHQINR